MKSMLAMSLFVFVVGCSKKDDKPSDTKDKGAPAASAKEGGGGGDKADPPKAQPAEPAKAKEVDLAKMTVTAPAGWEGQFNKALNDWSYEKYTPKPGDDMNEANHLYITNLPEDAPVDVEAYASKLSDDKFQDFGYKYSKIADKAKTPDGWLIKGTVEATKPMDADDKPYPGFVMMREIDGARIRCRAGTMRSEKIRDEAIELCKSIKLGK